MHGLIGPLITNIHTQWKNAHKKSHTQLSTCQVSDCMAGGQYLSSQQTAGRFGTRNKYNVASKLSAIFQSRVCTGSHKQLPPMHRFH